MFLFLYVLKNFAHLITARCNWSFVRNVRDVLQVITKYAKLCRNGIIGHFCHNAPSAICIKHQPRLGVVGITSKSILLIPLCLTSGRLSNQFEQWGRIIRPMCTLSKFSKYFHDLWVLAVLIRYRWNFFLLI